MPVRNPETPVKTLRLSEHVPFCLDRGRARGRARGRVRGRARGRARGRDRGRARDRARGRARGRAHDPAHDPARPFRDASAASRQLPVWRE